MGDVIVILTCLPESNKSDSYILDTEIIDTGIGITQQRQEMLFVPFMELKKKQNLKSVKDKSLGMGLACSKEIARAMGGDITIKQS